MKWAIITPQNLKWSDKIGLNSINWPVQFPNLNSIKNPKQIIKMRVGAHRNTVQSLKEMKMMIEKE